MKKSILLNVLTLSLVFTLSNCKKSTTKDPEPTPTPTPTAQYVLVIDDGAQSLEVGKSLSLSAHLVSSSGSIVNPSGITWSSNVGGVTGSVFSLNTATVGIISASVQYEGVTYTSSIPVSVQPDKSSQLFAVVPSAIIWSTNSGPIQLNTVYLGGSATYAFVSDNSSIASVSASGLVTFNAVGNTTIKVTATINGQTSVVNVPVMVVGVPAVTLPVTRIVVSPPLGELFRGETLQLNAKAYNSNGDDVTSTVSFSYAIVPKQEDDNEPAIAASANASGLVRALTIGGAYVKVTANGVMGQSEIVVNPDTVLLVNPFYASLGGMDISQFPPVQNPTNITLTATTQKVDRAKYRAKNPNFLTTIPNPANLQWELPTIGIPEYDDIFKVVTLSNATNTSVKVTAIPNKVGSTFVVAHAGIYGGVSSIMVNP